MSKVVKGVAKATMNVVTLGNADKVQEMWDDVSGKTAKRQARAHKLSAEELAAEQLNLAREQWEYNKGFLEEDRQKADDNFSRQLGIADEMMAAATFSPGFYDQQIGGATAAVRGSMGRAREADMRQMGRLGINPASGRFADASARHAMASGLAEANTANTTRSALGAEERSRQDAARVYGLQLAPAYPGRSVSNPAINVLGSQASNQYALAAAREAQGNSALGGLMQVGGTILGTALGGPVGGAIGGAVGGAVGGGGGGGFTPPSADPWGGMGLDLSWNG